MSVKVAYGRGFGGFELSRQVLHTYNEKRKMEGLEEIYNIKLIESNYRHDPLLIEAIKSSGNSRKIGIADIDSKYKNCYEIHEYDGYESVVCDPARLIEYRLRSVNIDELAPQQCYDLLREFKELIELR